MSAQQARDWLPRFARHGIEFVEEPCPPAELPRLPDLGIPLALDESLSALRVDSSAADACCSTAVRVVILKPSLLGGFSACARWAGFAERRGLDVVLSHAFDGRLGLGSAAALALAIGTAQRAHGLDAAGAGLEAADLPFFSSAHVEPWPDPGFGLTAGFD
jgi:L-alanine-DL-glutamate epimerase-like enolase superfamily enzyme